MLGCVRLPASSRATGTLRFAPLVTLRLELAHARVTGMRTMSPIVGGVFEGARLRGKVLASGSRSTLARSDDVVEYEIRALLATDDGELIQLAMAGNDARTISRFEAASPRYAFLNRIFAVGTAERDIHTLDELL